MKIQLRCLLPLFACTFAFACGSGQNNGESPDSSLSSVTIGDFVPKAGFEPWVSGEIIVLTSLDKKELVSKTFTSAESKSGKAGDSNFKVPHGSYIIRLNYYKDGKILLYKNCTEIPFKFEKAKESATVDMCSVKNDDKAGNTDGQDTSEIEVTPVLKDDPVDAGDKAAVRTLKNPTSAQISLGGIQADLALIVADVAKADSAARKEVIANDAVNGLKLFEAGTKEIKEGLASVDQAITDYPKQSDVLKATSFNSMCSTLAARTLDAATLEQRYMNEGGFLSSGFKNVRVQVAGLYQLIGCVKEE